MGEGRTGLRRSSLFGCLEWPAVRSLGGALTAAGLFLVGSPTVLAQDAKPESFGVVVASLSNPYFGVLARAAIARIREISPNARINTVSSDYNVATEARLLNRMLHDGTQVILLAAADTGSNAPLLERARKQGIAVIAVDVDVTGADMLVASDNHAAGESVCRYLAQQIGGHGNFIIQNGPQVSSVIDRVAGCKSALQGFSGIKLLTDSGNGLASPWGGAQLMAKQLKRFPKVDAVFAINDPQALGSETAALKAGRQEMVIGGVDASPEVIAAMQRKGLIVASAQQTPAKMAQHAVDIGVAVFGRHYRGPTKVLMPTQLVTRDLPSTPK